MGKHVIFLVHGMGVYSKKSDNSDRWKPDFSWHDKQKEILSELFATYPEINSGKSFDDTFDLNYIHYDEVFTTVLNKWSERADEILNTVTGDALEFGKKIVGWMKNGKLLEDFFYTHFGDVLLYRYFDHFQQAVLATVQRQMMEKIVTDAGIQPAWSIIGHSLGTKVVHDSVESLYSDSTINIGDEIKPATVIALIANVCDVLERQGEDVYNTSIFPSLDTANNSACRHLVSTSHKWDFFTQVDPYKPSGGRWTEARDSGRFINFRGFDTIDLNAKDWWNVHSFYNYMRHPGIFVPVFMKMLGLPSYIFPKTKLDEEVRKFELENSIDEALDSRFDQAKKDARKKLRAKLKKEYSTYIKPDLVEFVSKLKAGELPWKD